MTAAADTPGSRIHGCGCAGRARGRRCGVMKPTSTNDQHRANGRAATIRRWREPVAWTHADWDRAIDGLKAMLDENDRRRRQKRQEPQ